MKWCSVKEVRGQRVLGQQAGWQAPLPHETGLREKHNNALHRSGGRRGFLQSQVVRRRPVNAVDYEVRGLQVVVCGFCDFFVYMVSLWGRCLRRSRLSVAHPGGANGD